MQIDRIEVSHFRNIDYACVEFHKGSNVLIGENAQGKTNLLEAVYLMACGKSFRVKKFPELIQHGEKTATVSIWVSGEGLPFELKTVLDAKEGKAIYRNGVKIEKLSEFLGLFRVVLFCPEHLSLIKDGPAKRRSFLDSAICQLRPYYASLLNECRKVEAQRAALLKALQKKPVSPELIRVWNERLAQVSVNIACLRADYIHFLQKKAPLHFENISGGKDVIVLQYDSDVYVKGETREEMTARYLKTLEESLETDRRLGFTGKGVHRDDLTVMINSYSARSFASQGQQRSAVLALKLAEGEISREMTGQEPVYLLDDVLSELDEERRRYITGGLKGKQVILSGTDREPFSFTDKQITVKEGEFSQ